MTPHRNAIWPREKPISESSIQFWLLTSLIYLTLIYSTGLHHTWSVERTIEWSGNEFSHSRDAWKITSFADDAKYYVLQAKSLDLSKPPFKYRFLPTIVVGGISRLLGSEAYIPTVFAVLNVFCVFLTAQILTLYLLKDFNFSPIVSIVGGILFVTMDATTATISFPLLEPMSLLFTMLVFFAVIRGRPVCFLLSSAFGVATKEILVFSSLLWLLNCVSFRHSSMLQLTKNLIVSCVPIVVYAFIRVSLGGRVDEINYGLNLLDGQFPQYYLNYVDFKAAAISTLRVASAFGFLWLGLYNIRKNDFLYRSSLVIPPVILAAVLLSSHKARILGLLFPIVIPSFLYFLDRFTGYANREDPELYLARD